MNSQKLVPLIIKYSGLTAVGLLAYFLLMKLLGYADIAELRFLNFVIVLFGIRMFILRVKRENNGQLEYLQSLGYGFIVGAIASAVFSAFMLVYLAYIDHALLEHIQTNQRFGNYITPASAALVLMLEGCASSVITSFALAQYIGKETQMKQAD